MASARVCRQASGPRSMGAALWRPGHIPSVPLPFSSRPFLAKRKTGTITLDARDGPKPEMKAGASKIAPCLTPPRAPGLRNRPAPPGRALPFPAASKRGPFCMQIWGTDCLPIDNRERKRAFAEFRSMSWFRPRRKLILAELKLAIRWEPRLFHGLNTWSCASVLPLSLPTRFTKKSPFAGRRFCFFDRPYG